MKSYKITLTENEFWKLVMFIVMFEDKLTSEAEAYEKLVEDMTFSEEVRKKFQSNSEWYKETYKVIHKIRHKLDNIPF